MVDLIKDNLFITEQNDVSLDTIGSVSEKCDQFSQAISKISLDFDRIFYGNLTWENKIFQYQEL